LGSGLHPIASFSYRYTFSSAKSSGKGILNIGMELFVYYLSVSGTGNLGDVIDSCRKQSSALYFIQVHPILGA
jgi:hypothetical protein